jgi:ATP dependent DNA ligase C terminal region
MWALTKEEMKNCRWLKPELVAQIEFAEWTPDGHLRHSKFIGLREDKDPWAVRRQSARRQSLARTGLPAGHHQEKCCSSTGLWGGTGDAVLWQN